MDPRAFRVKYGTILCKHAGLEVTATTEIVNDHFDAHSQLYTLEVGLHYPRRSTGGAISLATVKTQGGNTVAVKQADYTLTQKDFDAVISGEVIDVLP